MFPTESQKGGARIVIVAHSQRVIRGSCAARGRKYTGFRAVRHPFLLCNETTVPYCEEGALLAYSDTLFQLLKMIQNTLFSLTSTDRRPTWRGDGSHC